MLAVPTAVVAAALAGSPMAAASPAPTSANLSSASAATTRGIIMRDGGICDPIRHMGC